MDRVARSIRLPPDLWHALDAAALDAGAKSGRFRSANALIEEILRAGLRDPIPAREESAPLDKMRAARHAKQIKDRERVDRLLALVRALRRSGANPRRAALDHAKATIERWRRRRLASPQYIAVWERLLAGGISEIERAIQEGFAGLGPEALAANAPFMIGPVPARQKQR
ncbi:MAG: hypothetical protein ACKVQU_14340 [Burkholderiales bacterium]